VKRHRIYIAGPLSSPTCTGYLQNVARFYEMDRALRRRGYAPYNPAADLLVGIMEGDLEYNDYFEPNLAWLEAAEAVLLIAPSPGADRECERARRLGIPVYRSLVDLYTGLHACEGGDAP
jgi:hypothetical protein